MEAEEKNTADNLRNIARHNFLDKIRIPRIKKSSITYIAAAAGFAVIALMLYYGLADDYIIKPLLGGADLRAERYARQIENEVNSIFLEFQLLDATLSVLESINLTAGFIVEGSVSITQALDPINHLIDSVSDTLMYASFASVFLKMMIPLAKHYSMAYIASIGFFCLSVASVLTVIQRCGRRAFYAMGLGLLCIAALLRFGVPLCLNLTEAAVVNIVDVEIRETERNLRHSLHYLTPPMKSGIVNEMRSIERWAESLNITKVFSDIFNSSFNIVAMYLLKAIVIPVFFMFALWKSLVGMTRSLSRVIYDRLRNQIEA